MTNAPSGRLDSRFVGIMASAEGQTYDFDPAMHAIVPPYTAVYNQYVREALGYKTDLNYEIMSSEVNQNWKYERRDASPIPVKGCARLSPRILS